MSRLKASLTRYHYICFLESITSIFFPRSLLTTHRLKNPHDEHFAGFDDRAIEKNAIKEPHFARRFTYDDQADQQCIPEKTENSVKMPDYSKSARRACVHGVERTRQ